MLLAAALCDLSAAEHPIQATIYVSPEGAGNGSSPASPCSLLAARDKVRKINGTMTGDIVVELAGGVYRMVQPLELLETDTIHDSGNNGFDIIYQAAPGARPVLSGGLALKNWTLFDKEKNIYRAQVPAGTQSRQLFVNGLRAERARSELRPKDWFKIESGWGCLDQSMAKWRNPSDIEIVSRSSWKHLRCGVASIKIETITPLAANPPRAKPGQPTPTPVPAPTPVQAARVDMKTPGWFNASKSPKPGPPLNGGGTQQMNNVEWVENAFELLTKPGQWYLDRSENFVYYIPREGEDLSNAVLARLEKLIDARGSGPEHRIHNLQFRGLTFAYATWLFPSGDQGYADNQTGVLWVNVPPGLHKTDAAISFQYASNVRFERNVVAHMGGSAIDFGHAPQHNAIVGNCIFDISGNGIFLGEFDDAKAAGPGDWTDSNLIANNYIEKPGVEFEDQIGICVGFSRNLVLDHNEVFDCPYTGISVGWGWSKLGYSFHNTISNNAVGFYMKILSDGGGIYTLGNQGDPEHKTIWSGNYVHHGAHGQGLYSDEGSGFMDIHDNVVGRVGANWMNIWCGSIHDVDVHNNFSDKTNVNNRGTNCTVHDNIDTISIESLPEAAAAIVRNAGLEPAFADIKKRIPLLPVEFVNDDSPQIQYTGSWAYNSRRPAPAVNGDAHVTQENGAAATLSFNGHAIDFLVETVTKPSEADVFIDDKLEKTVSLTTPERLGQQTVFHYEWKQDGPHTIKIVKKSGQYLYLDGFRVTRRSVKESMP
ncbi:MAG: hypothetical protein WCI20_08800 [bacterium]